MPSDSELGRFLRASRGRVSPDAVGLTSASARRVPGLRREEVATLAGVSVDYYIRLEQGRELHPSAQVVAAITRVLRLDPDARQHVYRLAGLMPVIDLTPPRADAAPALRELLDAWPHTPAMVFTHAYDVLASNALGEALFAPVMSSANLVVAVFLNPEARAFYPDWKGTARDTAGALRLAAGTFPGDHRIEEVVQTVSRSSEEFRLFWADPHVVGKTTQAKRLRHPEVGELDLTMQTFDVRSAPGQQLIVYHPHAGTRSSDSIQLLGALAHADAADGR